MEINSKDKIYRLTGIDSAMEMLRPSATWEITDGKFTKWEDDRPQPSMEEIQEVQQKARDFEDSINTIWTEKQKVEILKIQEKIHGVLD